VKQGFTEHLEVPGVQECRHCFGCQRTAKKITLRLIAMLCPQVCHLLQGLNSLGNDGVFKTLPYSNDGAYEDCNRPIPA
jgi:hypothetical protein